MSRSEPFNLSAWAIDHAPLLRYLMVVLLVGGLFAFVSLGQDEDPPFTFRAMVVRAYWPGATATQMAEQVTDKLEKKLQETPGVDKIRSYSKPGETLIFVQVNEATRGRDVADAWYQVRKKVGDIRGTLPPTVQVQLVRDDSEFIRASLDAIEEHLVLGGILAAIIVFIFLRNFRTTLIAAVAIPTSIIGAFAVIAALGFTLNQMTMLALTLMVGIVIDDAIVVLENIYRFVEEKGMSPFQAAIDRRDVVRIAEIRSRLAELGSAFAPELVHVNAVGPSLFFHLRASRSAAARRSSAPALQPPRLSSMNCPGTSLWR